MTSDELRKVRTPLLDAFRESLRTTATAKLIAMMTDTAIMNDVVRTVLGLAPNEPIELSPGFLRRNVVDAAARAIADEIDRRIPIPFPFGPSPVN